MPAIQSLSAELIHHIHVTYNNLEALDLSRNEITKIENLAPLAKLLSLDLSNNRIQVIENLDCLPSLRELSLESNEITCLPWSLPGLSMLEHLNLAGNQIGADELPQLVACLRSLPRLRHLLLAGNPLAWSRGYWLYVTASLPTLETLDGLPCNKGSLPGMPPAMPAQPSKHALAASHAADAKGAPAWQHADAATPYLGALPRAPLADVDLNRHWGHLQPHDAPAAHSSGDAFGSISMPAVTNARPLDVGQSAPASIAAMDGEDGWGQAWPARHWGGQPAHGDVGMPGHVAGASGEGQPLAQVPERTPAPMGFPDIPLGIEALSQEADASREHRTGVMPSNGGTSVPFASSTSLGKASLVSFGGNASGLDAPGTPSGAAPTGIPVYGTASTHELWRGDASAEMARGRDGNPWAETGQPGVSVDDPTRLAGRHAQAQEQMAAPAGRDGDGLEPDHMSAVTGAGPRPRTCAGPVPEGEPGPGEMGPGSSRGGVGFATPRSSEPVGACTDAGGVSSAPVEHGMPPLPPVWIERVHSLHCYQPSQGDAATSASSTQLVYEYSTVERRAEGEAGIDHGAVGLEGGAERIGSLHSPLTTRALLAFLGPAGQLRSAGRNGPTAWTIPLPPFPLAVLSQPPAMLAPGTADTPWKPTMPAGASETALPAGIPSSAAASPMPAATDTRGGTVTRAADSGPHISSSDRRTGGDAAADVIMEDRMRLHVEQPTGPSTLAGVPSAGMPFSDVLSAWTHAGASSGETRSRSRASGPAGNPTVAGDPPLGVDPRRRGAGWSGSDGGIAPGSSGEPSGVAWAGADDAAAAAFTWPPATAATTSHLSSASPWPVPAAAPSSHVSAAARIHELEAALQVAEVELRSERRLRGAAEVEAASRRESEASAVARLADATQREAAAAAEAAAARARVAELDERIRVMTDEGVAFASASEEQRRRLQAELQEEKATTASLRAYIGDASVAQGQPRTQDDKAACASLPHPRGPAQASSSPQLHPWSVASSKQQASQSGMRGDDTSSDAAALEEENAALTERLELTEVRMRALERVLTLQEEALQGAGASAGRLPTKGQPASVAPLASEQPLPPAGSEEGVYPGSPGGLQLGQMPGGDGDASHGEQGWGDTVPAPGASLKQPSPEDRLVTRWRKEVYNMLVVHQSDLLAAAKEIQAREAALNEAREEARSAHTAIEVLQERDVSRKAELEIEKASLRGLVAASAGIWKRRLLAARSATPALNQLTTSMQPAGAATATLPLFAGPVANGVESVFADGTREGAGTVAKPDAAMVQGEPSSVVSGAVSQWLGDVASLLRPDAGAPSGEGSVDAPVLAAQGQAVPGHANAAMHDRDGVIRLGEAMPGSDLVSITPNGCPQCASMAREISRLSGERQMLLRRVQEMSADGVEQCMEARVRTIEQEAERRVATAQAAARDAEVAAREVSGAAEQMTERVESLQAKLLECSAQLSAEKARVADLQARLEAAVASSRAAGEEALRRAHADHRALLRRLQEEHSQAYSKLQQDYDTLQSEAARSSIMVKQLERNLAKQKERSVEEEKAKFEYLEDKLQKKEDQLRAVRRDRNALLLALRQMEESVASQVKDQHRSMHREHPFTGHAKLAAASNHTVLGPSVLSFGRGNQGKEGEYSLPNAHHEQGIAWEENTSSPSMLHNCPASASALVLSKLDSLAALSEELLGDNITVHLAGNG
eukprot:jgi/Mesvir1/2021/Mv25885-RA.2